MVVFLFVMENIYGEIISLLIHDIFRWIIDDVLWERCPCAYPHYEKNSRSYRASAFPLGSFTAKSFSKQAADPLCCRGVAHIMYHHVFYPPVISLFPFLSQNLFFLIVTSFTHFRASILFKKLFDFAVRRTHSLQSVLFKMGIIKHLLHFNYFHLWVRMAPSKRKAVPDAAWVPEPE